MSFKMDTGYSILARQWRNKLQHNLPRAKTSLVITKHCFISILESPCLYDYESMLLWSLSKGCACHNIFSTGSI